MSGRFAWARWGRWCESLKTISFQHKYFQAKATSIRVVRGISCKKSCYFYVRFSVGQAQLAPHLDSMVVPTILWCIPSCTSMYHNEFFKTFMYHFYYLRVYTCNKDPVIYIAVLFRYMQVYRGSGCMCMYEELFKLVHTGTYKYITAPTLIAWFVTIPCCFLLACWLA